ncbi:HNH endonuclease signature motif containing protein [Natronorubrum halophilum]|uniref:HNH endonuclease signature motif containing protein n=1 Tax=Natronorubrum halophilum TaxID=1702106 RepID=UPI001EE815D1|nr:HNH endonuclease signature motif containing protein [Natronorubrum halophilum]
MPEDQSVDKGIFTLVIQRDGQYLWKFEKAVPWKDSEWMNTKKFEHEDVAHILPWSDYPEYQADLQNMLLLSKIHHAAFDRELFTIDVEFHLQVNPQLRRTANCCVRRFVTVLVSEFHYPRTRFFQSISKLTI